MTNENEIKRAALDLLLRKRDELNGLMVNAILRGERDTSDCLQYKIAEQEWDELYRTFLKAFGLEE